MQQGQQDIPQTAVSLSASVKFSGLTSMRFLAALAVIAHHTVGFKPGYGGVSLFFVLSGFVLAHSYAHRVETAAQRVFFWKGRIKRIWPAHIVTMAFAIPLGVPTLGVLIANALLLQGWTPDSAVYFSLNAVSWSLCAEAFFYFCFPFIARIKTALVIAILCAVTAGALYATLQGFDPKLSHALFYINPVFRIPEFMAGIVLARITLREVKDRYLLIAWALTFAIVWIYPEQPLTLALAFLPASALTIIGLAHRSSGWAVQNTLVELGEASFLLYMVAQLCQRYAIGLLGEGLTANLVSIPIALAISYAVHFRKEIISRYRLSMAQKT